MPTDIELDEALLARAMRLGGILTKEEAINQAISEYVQRREQLKILDFFGMVALDPDYDHKKQRRVE